MGLKLVSAFVASFPSISSNMSINITPEGKVGDFNHCLVCAMQYGLEKISKIRKQLVLVPDKRIHG